MIKKKLRLFGIIALMLAAVTACSNPTDEATPTKETDNLSQSTDDSSQSSDKTGKSDNRGDDNNEQSSKSSDGMSKGTNAVSTSENSDANKGDKDTEPLSEYSSQQIEYARIWLQLGPNQELDELYVRHILADTPLNPDDDTSAGYPEDVIQLAGTRLVDGSVTYSGNGDGTINVYNVPLRWDGNYPAGKDFYIDIINNTKLIYVDPGDDKKIVELIKLQHVH